MNTIKYFKLFYLQYVGIQQASLIHDIFKIQQLAGLTLPEWAKAIFPKKTYPLLKYYLDRYTLTSYMKKVRAGPFITEIVDIMRKKMEGNLFPNRNILIYSGHDLNIWNAMRALEVSDQYDGLPDFSSALIFELHALNSSNDHEIQVYH